MKTRLPLLALCLLAAVAQAQESKVRMWMWKDANGVVHYSDVPGPGAVPVDIAVSPGQSGASAPSRSGNEGSSPAPAASAGYNSLQIVLPANETSYFDADSVVEVQIAADPFLRPGDSIYLFLDGQRVGSSGEAMSYSLSSIDRGTHTLTAAIVDSQGNEKIRSGPVVFYMKQTTIGAPAAVGPNLKPPPPKPTPKPKTGG
ncbi:MAG TPA: DUF4124 domain-containing protein [Steroidobacteraceae bacterium]|nr:DUF4124 domain-containing protein [Steroidobacteraceae bacterium]